MAKRQSKLTRVPLQDCNVVRFIGKRGGQVVIACKTCGTEFIRYASHPNAFCSQVCNGKATAERYANNRIKRTCKHCGTAFDVPQWNHRAMYCCLKCKQTAVARRTAKTRAAKQRGKGTAPDGGLLDTTYGKLNGRHAHRVVAEEKIGRALLPGEIVHHIDGNKHNNHPDNLQVMTQSEHARLHATERHAKRRQAVDSGYLTANEH